MNETKMTQMELIKEYFRDHPNKDVKHTDVVPWLVEQYRQRTGQEFRDPDRGIRQLSQDGFLQKIRKGVYRHDPQHVKNRELEDFTAEQKEQIMRRDGHRCVICGRGSADGVELHVDHIKPKDFGGKAEISNGQTLCAQHNFLKKTFKQTETGKRRFIRLYELAKKEGDQTLMTFCRDVLHVFKQHNINGHIKWEE